MYIVGIDIGKNNHEATIVDDFGKPIGKSCRFTNTHSGADRLMQHIQKHIGQEACVFGMEAFNDPCCKVLDLQTRGETYR